MLIFQINALFLEQLTTSNETSYSKNYSLLLNILGVLSLITAIIETELFLSFLLIVDVSLPLS
jgi:hypothetical protein